jgi:hypothetical protein
MSVEFDVALKEYLEEYEGEFEKDEILYVYFYLDGLFD